MKQLHAVRPVADPLKRSGILSMLAVALFAWALGSAILLDTPAYANTESLPDTTPRDSPQKETVEQGRESATDSNDQTSDQIETSSQIIQGTINKEDTPVKNNPLTNTDKTDTLNDNQAATTPLDPPDTTEKSLVFHTGDTSPYLTAFFDGKEAAHSGWVLHKGSWYWFNQSPYATENSWIKTDESWYYLDETGKLKTGVFSDGTKIYLADPSGHMLNNGWHQLNGTWYWLEVSGAAKTGWLNLAGTWYWLDPETGAMATGWYKDGETWYFSDASGAMLANRWLELGGAWYYLNPSGDMRTGWLLDRGYWYWLDRGSGAMTKGFVDDNGATYYCEGSGRMVANQWVGSTADGWCWAQADGSLASGWGYLSGKWYYFDPATPQHRAKTGLYSVGENQCFSNADGALCTNRWVNTSETERRYANNQGYLEARQVKGPSGAFAFVDADNNPLSGWQVVGGCYFYAHPSTGEMATGWLELDDAWYYLDAQGVRQTGWVNLGGTWYYLDPSDGIMKTGWIQVNGIWYYLGSENGAMQTGWLQLGGDWYYLQGSGAMVANSSVRVSDGTYWYMNGSGRHDRQAGIDIIMRAARSLLGVPYVWLGVYPQDGGMDCASFTWYLYKQLGIDIGFETYDQMYSGVRVFGDAQPGDIILMYYGSWPNYNSMLPEHVVLYAGGGMIYEEPTFGGRCQYVPLALKGASTTTVRRILS